MILDLELDTYLPALKTKSIDGKVHLWDCIRKRYLVLQPEELVRQLLIHHLVKGSQYPQGRIVIERGLEINATERRYDVMICDASGAAFMVVECKAFSHKLDQAAIDQISLYNSRIKAPYVLLTNGKVSYCAAIDHSLKSATLLDALPAYPH